VEIQIQEGAMHRSIEELAHRWLRPTAGGLGALEKRVLQSTIEQTAISKDINKTLDSHETFGERVADNIAKFGGSWTFILGFIAFLLLWTFANQWLFGKDAFDPYPFIFLNLVLSMLAALQAPVIMMSQNRQTERDRVDASHDYEVNLKAELEIMALHEKLDELRHSQLLELRNDMAEMARQFQALSDRIDSRLGPSLDK
jgi:uncharacterized membrane protein